MKNHLLLLVALLFTTLFCVAQKKENVLSLKSGPVTLQPNVSYLGIDSLNKKIDLVDRALLIIQFNELPTEVVKQQLAAAGIQLLNYISDNAYTVSSKGKLNFELLKMANARVVFQPTAIQKMDSRLASGNPPTSSVKIAGTVDVWINFSKAFTLEEVIALLKQLNVNILSSDFGAYEVLSLRIATNRIFELAEQSFIEYVLPAPPPEQPLLDNNRTLSRGNVLNSSVANGGKGLKGEGVTIGIGDNADIQYHIDFKGRLINNTSAPGEGHGTHVSGIVAGGGLVNEPWAGFAPKATIISNAFSNIIQNSNDYVPAYHMVVTNNSYGALLGCENNGVYDLSSSILDRQAFDLPHLQHVFAVGNSGSSTCAPYPAGSKTVLGGFQSAKNILTVGYTSLDLELSGGSSQGPTHDGRIKPDVTAMGINVVSTWPGNTYLYTSGSSMSAPAVTGGAALLYQRYRQLHSGADPKNALIKALMCNGATDVGNSGPDFKFGFGSMNLFRSVGMLDKGHYYTNTLSAGGIQNHSFSVPANTAKVKVMLYWNDPAASLLAAKTLVNDLDLEIIDPASATILPLILDATASHVNDLAVNGADHINNVEQAVLKNPVQGNYTIKVKGTSVAVNPSQEYFVVYDIIPNSIQVTYPVGGEGMGPGESVRIAWESYGDEGSSFTIQYSTDAGVSWTVVENNVSPATQVYTWVVPAMPTDKALIKITKNATGQSSTSNPFTIIGVPAISLSAVQCEGYINVDWSNIPGATDYEIMMLRGDEMSSVALTINTSYSLNSLSKDSTYLVSVRARINGKPGRRAYGLLRQPADGSCSGSISDNDLKLNAIVSPVSGRKFTSFELTNTSPVTIEIKNLDDAAVSGFTAHYSIDGGTTWVTENITASIAPGAVYTHTFSATANLSAVSNYSVVAVVRNNTADIVTANDTLRTIVKHIDNQPINLGAVFLDNLEGALAHTYQADTLGLGGAERYDFKNNNIYGRLRPFIYANSGMAYSGSKAFTLDVDRISFEDNTNHVIGTFNLSNYNAATNEVRLDFRFTVHGLNIRDSSKVWIRGDDTKPWIEMYNLWSNRPASGVYKLSAGLELGDSLLKYGQNFSSSFQIQWTQLSANKAVQKNLAGGLSIDDIRLYEALNDAQMLSIDTPSSFSCGLNEIVPLKVTIRNGTKNVFTNLPVKYSINGGAWVSEIIPSLAGETTMQYTFTSKLNLATPGVYTIKAIVDYPGDNVRDNDTAILIGNSAPLISSLPHIQNFEAGNGGWYTEGTNNSWAYGIPTAPKINRAASGARVWKTNLSGNHNDQETSYLYSPCYQVGGLSHPTLSFSAAFDLEDCGTTTCDAVMIQYSTDGKSWFGLMGSMATNGYNGPGKTYWSIQDYTRWHVVTMALPKGIPTIRLRFAFFSDPAVNREGVAIDDIHVYDSTKAIYDGPTMSTPVVQTISGGTSWAHFEKDGKLVASIQPNNQNLGPTNVQAYINTDSIRNTSTLYYHNRNITIKPKESALTDSAMIRFYFLDSETETLINASGCVGCNKPASAYELGVSQYDDYDTSFENGSINDDLQGLWTFIHSDKVVKVPFQKGYYAEFKVRDFSEFWLGNGLINGNVLPVKLFNFSVKKTGSEDVSVNWTVGAENNVSRYEIEVARNDADLQNNNFERIGAVPSRGNSNQQQTYDFTDAETFKTGARYYRIKTVNLDGTFHYSIIRSVVFNSIAAWQVVPNPSTGLFYLIVQANVGEKMNLRLTDAIGQLVKTYTVSPNGFTQKFPVDLSGKGYAPGIYLLQLTRNGKPQTYKLYKH